MRLIDSDVLIKRTKEEPTDGFFINELLEILKKQPTIESDKWIPVTERFPECEEEVWIQTKKGTKTTAMYEDGKTDNNDSGWSWTDIDFVYDEEKDTEYIPEGWWEYRHFNPDDFYNNLVDEEVIAWKPLPKPYEGETE